MGATLSKEARAEGTSKRRALTSKFIEALQRSWELNGADAIEQLRLEDNTAYCQLVAKLTPVETRVEVEQTMPELEHLKTSEEVFAWIEGEIANLRAQQTLRVDYEERINAVAAPRKEAPG